MRICMLFWLTKHTGCRMLYLLALCMAAESFSLVNEACQNVI